MTKTKLIFFFLALLIPSIGCKDEFLLETKNYNPILVVDGIISNEVGPYKIKISQSSPVNEFENVPLEGCNVTIIDNLGNIETLIEIKPGEYITTPYDFQAEVGKSYQLSIETPNEKIYSSNFQEIKEPLEIDSAYAQLSSVYEEGFPNGLPGYQFYVDTEESPDQENYFLWRTSEAYEFMVDFDLYDIIFGIARLDTNAILRDSIIQKYRSKLSRCWKSEDINYIVTGKTTNLSNSRIVAQPIQFVGINSRRLQIRYSLNIKQYTVNKDSYNFWQKVEEHTTNENFLIATQPYNINGNIKNENNPDEIIFGFFTAASVVEKRIFVNNPNMPVIYDKCSLVTDPQTIFEIFRDNNPPFYLIEFDNSYGFGVLVYEYCVNCTLSGGSSKPDFWVEQ